MNDNILILSQVVFKGFIEVYKRLPQTNEDTQAMETAILKTYKSALLAQQKINLLK